MERIKGFFKKYIRDVSRAQATEVSKDSLLDNELPETESTSFSLKPGRILLDAPLPEVPKQIYLERAMGIDSVVEKVQHLERDDVGKEINDRRLQATSKQEKQALRAVMNILIQLYDSRVNSLGVGESIAEAVPAASDKLLMIDLAGYFVAAVNAWQTLGHLKAAVEKTDLSLDYVLDPSIKETCLMIETGFEDMSLGDFLSPKTTPADKVHLLIKFLLFATPVYERIWDQITIPDFVAPKVAVVPELQKLLLVMKTENLHSVMEYLQEASFSRTTISFQQYKGESKDRYLHTTQAENVINTAIKRFEARSEEVLEMLFDPTEAGDKVRNELNIIFKDRHVSDKTALYILHINHPYKLIQTYRRVKKWLADGNDGECMFKLYNLMDAQLEENKHEFGIILDDEMEEYFEVLPQTKESVEVLSTTIRRAYGLLHGRQGDFRIHYSDVHLPLDGIKNAQSIEMSYFRDGQQALLVVEIGIAGKGKVPVQLVLNLSDQSLPFFDWNIITSAQSGEVQSEVTLILTLVRSALQKAVDEYQKNVIKEDRRIRAVQRKAQKELEERSTWRQSSGTTSNERLIAEVKKKKLLGEVKKDKRVFVQLPDKDNSEEYDQQFAQKVRGKNIPPEILSEIYNRLQRGNETGLFAITRLAGHETSRIRLVINGTHYRVIVFPAGSDSVYSKYFIEKIFIRNDEDQYENL